MSRRAPGEGALYQDKRTGRWVGQADVGTNPATGKRRRVKVSGDSKSEAAKRLKKKLGDLAVLSSSDSITVDELCQRWLDREAPKTMTPNTLNLVESLLRNHVSPVLGKQVATQLWVEDFEGLLDAKKAQGFARSTLVKLHSYLAQAYDFGLRRRLVVWNPARMAVVPAAPGKREPRALTAAELRSLLNVCRYDRLGAWVMVTVAAGLRPGETSGLEWDAVDLDAGVVHVHRSMAWTREGPVLKSTKTGKPRALSLPGVAVDALKAHKTNQAAERLLMGDQWPIKWGDLVFVTSNGTPLDPSWARRTVSKLTAEAGIEGHLAPYDLRHTATSLLSAAGVAPELLADLLGHADTRMVFKHYRHPVTPTVDVAATHFDRAVST